MSLVKAIHFRKLVTQLTHQERIQFVSKLVDSHLDMILKCLFQHFSKPSQIDQVADFNQSLLNIIQSRTEKPKQLCTNNIQLHQLPRSIIGYTASFLSQSNFITFSLSARSIYLGCNLPNTLQTLRIAQHTNYSCINLASFPSLKCLCIDPMKAVQAGNMRFDSPNFNQVTALRLEANDQREWVQPFLNQNIVNCENITTLYCKGFGSREFNMTGKEFLSLLTAFPNLTNLWMSRTRITGDISAQDIADLCPGIVSFSSYYHTNLISDLVKIFAPQLKCLALEQPRQNDFDFCDTQFGKLEELFFFGPNNKSCNGVVKSDHKSLNVKKICLMYWQDWMSDDGIKDDIANIMEKCRFLNHICIMIKQIRHFGSILDGIERGLLAIKMSKTQQRKNLKIYVSAEKKGDHDPAFNAMDFTINFGRIINSLEACDINDFMFVLNIPGTNDKLALGQIFSNMCNLSTKTKVIRVHRKFIITNENCKINGYRDSVCGLCLRNDGWFVPTY
eukprot:124959_1